jgi:hypothetical protein
MRHFIFGKRVWYMNKRARISIFSILLCSTIILGCRNADFSSIKSTLPKKVIELGVEKEFNEAKWLIYKFYSQCSTDILLKTELGALDTLRLGISHLTLPLTMTRLDLKNDTVFFSFFFLPEKGFLTTDPTCEQLNGVGFVGKDLSNMFFDFGDHWMRLNRDEFRLEFDEIAINQAFRKALTKEAEHLDPWLLSEARRRGELPGLPIQ